MKPKRAAGFASVAALALATLGSIAGSPRGTERPASQAAPRPELFEPGLVSTERAESAPAFSPDGREFYFSRADEGGRRQILVARRAGDGWTAPEPLPFADARYDDSKATLSADGAVMVFASNRPAPTGPAVAPTFLDLWMSTRQGRAWSEPKPLAGEVNTAWDEDFPVLDADGVLWFASNRSGGEYRIFRARLSEGRFETPELYASALDSGSGEAVCYVAPDGRYLLFMSMRPGGAGAIDLYAVFREPDGAWAPAANLGSGVNSPGLDWFATVSPDGRSLFFTSDRTGGGDIYRVDAAVIGRGGSFR